MAEASSASSASSPSVNLPDEIIMQILSRLPVKSLFRFKCVSKEWHSIISDTNFKLVTQQDAQRLTMIVSDLVGIEGKGICKYYSISDEQVLLLDKLDEYQTPIICWEDEVMKINGELITRVLGSCNGLVLFSLNEHIFLWNPSIRCCRKVLELNDLSETFSVVSSGIFYDSSVDDYKVAVILGFDGSDGESISFALLKEKKWQHLQSCYPVVDADDCCYDFFGGPVVNDRIHWLIGVVGGPSQILYFDFKSNKNEILPMPHDNHEYCDGEGALGLFDGCLCLFRTYGDDVLDRCRCYKVLVMKEYGDKDSWTFMFNVTLSALDDVMSSVFFTRGDGQGAFLISTNSSSIVVYDVENHEYSMVHECGEVYADNRVFLRSHCAPASLITRSTLVESLVSPIQYQWHGSSEDIETLDDILCVCGASDDGDDEDLT